MRRYMLAFLLFLSVSGVAQTSGAQEQSVSAPCEAAEHRQFDFWLGDWELSWPASMGAPAGKGINHITTAFDGCVIEEHFDGTPDMPLRGHSDSVFNSRSGLWQQTWVDNQGSYLDFTGRWRDGKMVLEREAVTAKGQRIRQRMVWQKIAPNSLDWSWERSEDGGKTWQRLWPIHYIRKH
jgi:hypothetical protein